MRVLRAILRQFWGPAPSWGWMLALGLAAGFMFGIAVGLAVVRVGVREHWNFVEVLTLGDNTALPRPVTPPPPGMVWAKVLTTGYCPCAICCPGSDDNRTAINRDVREHPFGIASDRLSRNDPGLFTAGTMLDVPGYGHAMVDDVGGAMRQDAKKGIIHLDLRFSDHQVARRWGRKLLWIAVPADSGAARLAPASDQAGR